MKTGVAWYKHEQWDRLLEISTDSDQLESNYEEWIEQAYQGFRDLSDSGLTVKIIHIDVEELLKWCRANNRPVDGTARSEYVAPLVKKLDSR